MHSSTTSPCWANLFIVYFCKSSQPAQLANHHQVSCRVDRFAKSALANQLANAHPGKVGLIAKLHDALPPLAAFQIVKRRDLCFVK